MSTAETLLTADEFERLPEQPEGGKTELVHGRVVTMVPVGGTHGQTAGRIFSALDSFVRQHSLGGVAVETGFRLAADHVRAPDVSFTARERLPGGRLPVGFVDGPPTLAVEVTSPEDRDAEIAAKVLDYLRTGARRVWIARPGVRTVTVHYPDGVARTLGADSVLSSDDAGFAAEGFELQVGTLFEDQESAGSLPD
jgi:Uma2 family endonuclease